MKKIILRVGIVVFLLFVIVFVVIPIIGYNKGAIDGEEWMKKQTDYLNDLKGVSETLDDVTSLYLSGGINYDDYIIHLGTVEQEFIIIKEKYNEETKDLVINDYTKEQKRATDSVKKSYDLLEELIITCKQDAEDMNVLSYEYLAAQQAIQKQMITYVTIVGGD